MFKIYFKKHTISIYASYDIGLMFCLINII